MVEAVARQMVVVETGLDERAGGRLVDGVVVQRTRHARTRFVEVRSATEPAQGPAIGDPWCPLTVRARLQRMNWVLTGDPRVKPAVERSCMPEPVREPWKDAARGTVVRVKPPRHHQTACELIMASLVAYQDEIDRHVIWALAMRKPDTDLAAYIGVSDKTARQRKEQMLALLAADWNARGWRPDADDIARANRFIHRNIK